MLSVAGVSGGIGEAALESITTQLNTINSTVNTIKTNLSTVDTTVNNIKNSKTTVVSLDKVPLSFGSKTYLNCKAVVDSSHKLGVDLNYTKSHISSLNPNNYPANVSSIKNVEMRDHIVCAAFPTLSSDMYTYLLTECIFKIQYTITNNSNTYTMTYATLNLWKHNAYDNTIGIVKNNVESFLITSSGPSWDTVQVDYIKNRGFTNDSWFTGSYVNVQYFSAFTENEFVYKVYSAYGQTDNNGKIIYYKNGTKRQITLPSGAVSEGQNKVSDSVLIATGNSSYPLLFLTPKQSNGVLGGTKSYGWTIGSNMLEYRCNSSFTWLDSSSIYSVTYDGSPSNGCMTFSNFVSHNGKLYVALACTNGRGTYPNGFHIMVFNSSGYYDAQPGGYNNSHGFTFGDSQYFSAFNKGSWILQVNHNTNTLVAFYRNFVSNYNGSSSQTYTIHLIRNHCTFNTETNAFTVQVVKSIVNQIATNINQWLKENEGGLPSWGLFGGYQLQTSRDQEVKDVVLSANTNIISINDTNSTFKVNTDFRSIVDFVEAGFVNVYLYSGQTIYTDAECISPSPSPNNKVDYSGFYNFLNCNSLVVGV